MRVVYKGNTFVGEPLKLIPKKEYIVYAVTFDKHSADVNGESIVYTLRSDVGGPCRVSADLFEISRSELNRTWVIYNHKPDNSFSLLNRNWAYERFWINYYDGEGAAQEHYLRGLEEVYVHEIQLKEILDRLEAREINEVSHILQLLIKYQDNRAREVALKIAASPDLHKVWEIAYRYLASYPKDEIIQLVFYEHLLDNAALYPNVTRIVQEYFERMSEEQ